MFYWQSAGKNTAKNPTAINERGRETWHNNCVDEEITQSMYQLWNQGVMKTHIIQQLLSEGDDYEESNRAIKDEERDKHLKWFSYLW